MVAVPPAAELLEADLAVAVLVDHLERVGDLLLRHLRRDALAERMELIGIDEAALVLVELPEGVADVGLLELVGLLVEARAELVQVGLQRWVGRRHLAGPGETLFGTAAASAAAPDWDRSQRSAERRRLAQLPASR